MYSRAAIDRPRTYSKCSVSASTAHALAVRLVPGDLGTFAGLRTDQQARVVNDASTPIPGLYAVGNDMASPMGGAYPGAGLAVGSAVTFGSIAARHLATVTDRSGAVR